MNEIYVSEIVKVLDQDYEIIGNINIACTNASSLNEATTHSIVFLNPDKNIPNEIIENTKAGVIICAHSYAIPSGLLEKKCFIKVINPRLAFIRILRKFFFSEDNHQIDQTAIINPKAKLGDSISIGPFSTIGECTIGNNTVIHENCVIKDGVIIGNNVVIKSGTVIGGDGFGYARNDRNEFEKFPHSGGVIIEDNVDIGSNTCIDRGTLGNTLIKEGTKIDNLVHIAHNVVIGRHSAVIACSMIGGSTIIGDYAWISPSVSIMNGIQIGSRSTIGLGTTITKPVKEGEVWIGFPSKLIDIMVKISKTLNNLIS